MEVAVVGGSGEGRGKEGAFDMGFGNFLTTIVAYQNYFLLIAFD